MRSGEAWGVYGWFQSELIDRCIYVPSGGRREDALFILWSIFGEGHISIPSACRAYVGQFIAVNPLDNVLSHR